MSEATSAGDQLIVCCVCSIPRWDFARSLHSEKPDSSDFLGVSKAVRSILDSTQSILEGNDRLVEVLICGEENADYIRSMCAKSLLSCLAYVIRSNSAYFSASWKVLRGEMDFSDAERYFGQHNCCDESGLQVKLRNYIRSKSDVEKPHVMEALSRSFSVGSRVLLLPAGFTTEEAESSFSVAQNTGVRDPHRSLMLSTVAREVGINWAVKENKKVFDAEIKKCFGSIKDFQEASRQAFLHSNEILAIYFREGSCGSFVLSEFPFSGKCTMFH